MSEQLQESTEKSFLNELSWKERKASEDATRIAFDKQPKRGRYKKFIDNTGNNLWHYWAYNDKPEKIFDKWSKRLEQEDVNLLNSKGEHVLHRLALCGKCDAIKLLAEKYKFDNSLINLQGETLLHYACWSGCDDTTRTILTLYPELLDIQDSEGYTALSIAINRCGKKLTDDIIMMGANPNIADSKGKTALHYAAEKGNVELYDKLESFGADGSIKDRAGKTPESIIAKFIERTEEENHRYDNFWKNKYNQKLVF